MSKNPLEALFNVIYRLLSAGLIEAKKVEWEKLDNQSKQVLDKTMNGGIKRNMAKYTVCELTGSNVCLAEYYDSDEDFSAYYLLFGSEIIYANEF